MAPAARLQQREGLGRRCHSHRIRRRWSVARLSPWSPGQAKRRLCSIKARPLNRSAGETTSHDLSGKPSGAAARTLDAMTLRVVGADPKLKTL